ncbi:MAG: SH3 domain-containing protein [Saprospiraceae bacterium]
MRYLAFALCLFLLACQPNSKESTAGDKNTNADLSADVTTINTESKPNSKPIVFTTNLDNLRLRDQPGTEGKEIARLPLGTKVYDTGEVSDFTTSLKLRGVKFDEPWIKIKTAQGLSGWIYGGGLSYNLDPNNPAAQALMQKRLAGLFGSAIAEDIENYTVNYNNASTSAGFAKVYDQGVALRDRFVELLEKKVEVNHENPADLFWLKQAIPGYVPQLAAEGTIYYLFNDYRQFEQKAKSTSGKEDDEMAQLFYMVHKGDSVEYFYPSWFMQTWDYGGHSLLGRGTHTAVLQELDRLNQESEYFAKPIRDIKEKLITDITEQYSAYWEPKEKVLKELANIIAADYNVFTKEDKVTLETRMNMMESPKENKIEFNARAGMGQ